MRKLITALVMFAVVPAWSLSIAPPTANVAVEDSNRLGFNLIETIAQESQNKGEKKNTMVSPISMYFSLSMAMNGAGDDRTLNTFLENVFFEKPVNGFFSEKIDPMSILPFTQFLINYPNKGLLDYYAPMAVKQEPSSKFDTSVPPVVSINNLIANTSELVNNQPKYAFSAPFKLATRKYYSAEALSFEFKSEGAADQINSWVNEKTNEMIPEIISQKQIKDLMWVLVNTVYFEGQWANSFSDLSAEQAPDFTSINNTVQDVEMISSFGRFRVFEDNQIQVAALPFAKSRFEFVAVMPKSGVDFYSLGNQNEEGVWTQAFWQEIQNNLESKKGSLKVPKFSFDYGVEMDGPENPIVQGLGLSLLFTGLSDFSAMGEENSVKTQVGIIKQNTRIELDKNGLKAAAATIVGGFESTSLPDPIPSFNFVFDRPFYFAVFDKEMGTYLFLGNLVSVEK